MNSKSNFPRFNRLRRDWVWVDPLKPSVFRRSSGSPGLLQRVQAKEEEVATLEAPNWEAPVPVTLPRRKPKPFTCVKPRTPVKHRYSSPWYLPPRQWNLHSKLPEYERGYDIDRALNVYYYLQEPVACPDLLKPRRVSAEELKQEALKARLSGLAFLKEYREYLQTHKHRVPAFLQSLNLNEDNS